MRGVLAAWALALCLALSPALAKADSGESLKEKVDFLISRHPIHGLQRSQFLALGDSALPFLAEALRDESRKTSWGNAAAAIGLLGDTSYFDTLRVFIWHRFSGPLDDDTWVAIRLAQMNMAGIARRSPRATQYLIAMSVPKPWLRLPWTYQKDTREYQAELMAEGALTALSYVDTEPAYSYIASLDTATFPRVGTSRFLEVRRISRLVQMKGTLAVWKDQEQEPRH